MDSTRSNISANIFFGDEVELLCKDGPHSRLSAPTVFTGQKLSGSLFINCGVQEEIFDAVQLNLKGKVKSHVKTIDGCVREMEQPLIRMSCVKLASDFRRFALGGSLRIGYETDFFFDIPEFITLPSDDACMPHELPPSIRVIKSSTCAVAGNCDVTYFIEARILRHRDLVSLGSREIIVMPATEIPPPLEPGDLKREFQLRAASSIASLWNPTNGVTVVVSSTEPRPLVLPANKGEYGSTEVLLNFKTQGIVNENGDLIGPQLTDCDVMITLEAVTYFLAHEQESVMSMVEALESPFTVLKRTTFKTEKRHVNLTGWTRGREIASGITTRIFEWETSVSVPIILPEDFSRLPSFFSTLVARRYAFKLEIALGTRYSITSRKPIKLRVPVQIVHTPGRKSAIAPPEIEFDDLDAPPYVI